MRWARLNLLNSPQLVLDAYRIVQAAATKGYNVGTDEYPSMESFETLLSRSESFGIWRSDDTATDLKETEHLSGICTVASSVLARGSPVVVGEIRVFLSQELHKNLDRALRFIIPEAERVLSDMGYRSGVVRVAAVCSSWCVEMKRLGYSVTATFPRAVDMADHGLVSDFVFYNKLRDGTLNQKVGDRVSIAIMTHLHRFGQELIGYL